MLEIKTVTKGPISKCVQRVYHDTLRWLISFSLASTYPIWLPLFVKSGDAFAGLGRLAGLHVISQRKIDIVLH